MAEMDRDRGYVSFAEYLPPVVAATDADPTQFMIRFLRIFEELLVGLPAAMASENPPVAVEQKIDRLHDVFDPWTTDRRFLAWLARWVALDVPDDWSEYQTRRMIGEIASIFQQRWMRRGLYTYLDIYRVTETRPRIVIDGNDCLYRVDIQPGGVVQTGTLAFAQSLPALPGFGGVLLHPVAVAVEKAAIDRFHFVLIDRGNEALGEAERRPAVWRVSSDGELLDWQDVDGLPMPRPINAGDPPGQRLINPVALVVQQPGSYFVLDQGSSDADSDSAIYRYTSSGRDTIASGAALGAVAPVAMVSDGEMLFVLDRGSRILTDPANPALIAVDPDTGAATAHALGPTVVEPTALAVAGERTFIVADARKQFHDQTGPFPDDVKQLLAGDLLRVTFDADMAALSVVSLLADVPSGKNPLIFPVAVAATHSGSGDEWFVCDSGLKIGRVSVGGGAVENYRVMAEAPGLYLVDLRGDTPQISLLTDERKFVNPAAMAVDPTGAPVIADRGEYLNLASDVVHDWRAMPHQFGASLTFSAERPTAERDRIAVIAAIKSVLGRETPAHALFFLDL